MAAYNPHSPRARANALKHVTPLHSPQHSANSSISSRAPFHTLTLHEYRKQQSSPAAHIATPTGKTLRRKAAAPALQTVDRVSFAPTSRPVHLSQSAHQLLSSQPLPPSPPHLTEQQHQPDQLLRSQSAEPYGQGVATNEFFLDIGKVRTFNRIKRLPKPPAATGIHTPPPPLANVTPPHHHLSPFRPASILSAGNTNRSDSQPTPSTFSLSQFPQPPHHLDAPLSLSHAEPQPRLNTASFTTAAPATPPATPAVIHYRGASFDLVNPHESLWFHDIVTPSRELDSSDYLPLLSSEDLSHSEMAPKRALYGDFGSAYSNIARRDLEPLPPTPVAYSPGGSYHTSPYNSIDSKSEKSPRTLKRSESRWSLKHLTRNLTKNLAWSPKLEEGSEEELKDLSKVRKKLVPRDELSEPRPSLASPTFDGEFPRPLSRSYRAITPKSPTSPSEPPLPVSPLDRAMDVMSGSYSSLGEHSRLYSHGYRSAPLRSMVPDEPSTQVGRATEPRVSVSDEHMVSKPYYDTESIYASSSVYTGDDPSLANNRNSNALALEGFDANALAEEYKSDALYPFPSSRRTSGRLSRTLEREMFHRLVQKHDDDKTDTISKLIDRYKQADSTGESQSTFQREENTEQAGMVTSTSGAFQEPTMLRQLNARLDSGLDQFEFDTTHFQQEASGNNDVASARRESFGLPHRGTGSPGAPPQMAAPLAPPFEYDDIYQTPRRPRPSEMFSGVSSYGDSEQLLQLSQPAYPGHGLEPSSCYSQPEAPATPRTPQEALDLADQIFGDATPDPPLDTTSNQHDEQHDEAIPAIWARRGSGNLLRGRSETDNGSIASSDQLNKGDGLSDGEWETVGERSQPGRFSGRLSPGESLADVSDSDGSDRDSLGFSTSALPIYEDEPLEPGSFQSRYQHPSPLHAHPHPFNSSPPPLFNSTSAHSAPNTPTPTSPVHSPPLASTVPAFLLSPDSGSSSPLPDHSNQAWLNPMGLSDQQTQDLLMSGPNEDIMYHDHDEGEHGRSDATSESDGEPAPAHSRQNEILTSSPAADPRILPENSFDKITVVGPKGNLTGTPQGTGMKDAGSSAADNSSPGALLSSTPLSAQYSGRRVPPSGPCASLRESLSRCQVKVQPGPFTFASPMRARLGSSSSPKKSGFYTSPDAKASVTRVPRGAIPKPTENEKSPSQISLFPPPPAPERQDSSRRSRHSFRSPGRSRFHSRAAVPGQTKLRQMMLAGAPDTESLDPTLDSDVSRLIRTADSGRTVSTGRPSTANTHTPLRARPSVSTLRTIVAYEHSPHLLCPERAEDPQEEAERRKLSWWIFAMFCILPPMLILYRWLADWFIVNITNGRLHHASAKPKKVALGVGIAVNLGLSSAILLPILIAHAMGAL